MPGIDNTSGFVPMTFSDLVAAFKADYVGLYGTPNTDPTAVIGQNIVVPANMAAQLWSGLQLVYNSEFPNLTDAGSMPNVMALVGLTMKTATATVLAVSCTFTGAGSVPQGAKITDAAGNQYAAVSAIVAPGAGAYTGSFACTVAGPVPYAGTLVITDGQTNWSAVTWVSTALGAVAETLAQARIRRQQSLQIAGSGTIQSITAAVLNLPVIAGVQQITSCSVIENLGPTVDANGTPAYTMRVIVQGADPGTGLLATTEAVAVANAIWSKRAGATPLDGAAWVDITDSTGATQTVYFSYVTAVHPAVVLDYSLFGPIPPPADVTGALTTAIDSVFNAQAIGENVLYNRMLGACALIPGIKINTLTIDGNATDYTVTALQIAATGGTITITVS
jgi:hypothetical protein